MTPTDPRPETATPLPTWDALEAALKAVSGHLNRAEPRGDAALAGLALREVWRYAFQLKLERDVAIDRLEAENAALRAACEASWAIGHKVYHNANNHEAEQFDWPKVRRLLAVALGKDG